MTAFITHCWRRRLERAFLAVVAMLLVHGSVQAGSVEPKTATLAQDEQGLVVSASFAVKLGPRFEEAVERGIPLHFRFEFELTRKRWYVLDEHVAGRVLSSRLSYHALTRQYRLSFGSLHQNFESLDEALQTLGRVANLQVPLKTDLVAGETYSAAVRLSLDHEQLPKPLQVDALADRDWRIATRTHVWSFVPTPEKP